MADACTLWPDRWGTVDWSACCRAHDRAYELGLAKAGADLALAQCVADVAGWPMALLMGTGVFLFGTVFWIGARLRRR